MKLTFEQIGTLFDNTKEETFIEILPIGEDPDDLGIIKVVIFDANDNEVGFFHIDESGKKVETN